MEEQEKKGFVVRDRRKVSLDDLEGDVKKEEAKEEKKPDEPAKEEPKTAPGEEYAKTRTEARRYPEVTFSTFVFSLSSSALVHLGEVPDPVTNKVEKDLALAKQIIDTLAMLEEKTRGNLERDEQQLLQTVLYDLRLRFVKQSGK
ncbi:protein of unknown function [Desulfacinum infernum DSM 9756]|uniref:DUF1844 domain-containing protein n=1 Tax=Desulfacinum infernum DSM 9756 TaxID=1121391 RepID=A0A1M4YD62_9BACT|nr:DUF1844 domain-containing protein [Desulfacinum infernum]SHF03680.1 protein of unknown function [Desulfacinum infernum DSM 9756]